MSRYRYAVDQERAMVRALWIVIGGLMMLTLVLGFGLLTAPDRLVVHIPPDLRSGAQFDAGTVGPENVYSFSYYIFQQLNHWPEDGANDYGKAIFVLSPYLTPQFRASLIADMELKAKQGELTNRVRSLQERPGARYEERRVDVANDSWVVWLDFLLRETVHGMVVKEAMIRYPLRVVRYKIDPESNPWGLALDGFAGGGPHRLDALTSPGGEVSDEST